MTNEISLKGDNFYISYLAKPSAFAVLCDTFYTSATGANLPVGEPETAIVVEVDGDTNFYILRGDHRKQYLEFGTDLDKCLKYFSNNLHLIGPSSDILTEGRVS